MEMMKLEMIVRSASGLDDDRKMGQMPVYATASLSDDPTTILQKTVDSTGGTNPVWNSNMSFSISQTHFQHLHLVFGLYCQRTLLGDEKFGEVHVPLNALRAEHSNAYTEVSYPIFNLQNNSHRGKLNFSYKFQDNLPYPRPPTNYPAMGAGSGSAYGTSRPPSMRPQRPQNSWYSRQCAMLPPPPQHPWTRRDNIALAGVGVAAASVLVAGGELGVQITKSHGVHAKVNGQPSNNHDSTRDHNVHNNHNNDINDASLAWNMDGVGNEDVVDPNGVNDDDYGYDFDYENPSGTTDSYDHGHGVDYYSGTTDGDGYDHGYGIDYSYGVDYSSGTTDGYDHHGYGVDYSSGTTDGYDHHGYGVDYSSGTTDGYDLGYGVDYHDNVDASWTNDVDIFANDTNVFDICDVFLG